MSTQSPRAIPTQVNGGGGGVIAGPTWSPPSLTTASASASAAAAASTSRSSPPNLLGISQRRSPHGLSPLTEATPRAQPPGNIALPPLPSAHVLAQQLSLLSVQQQHQQQRTQSKSAPSSPMHRGRDIAPLSTITPIELGGSQPTSYMTAGSHMQPTANGHAGLAPAPHIESRLRHSPEVVLKALAQLQPQRMYTGQQPQRGQTIPPQTQPAQARRQRTRSRSRSNPKPPSSASSSEDTETEVDSDSTFVPGRLRHQHQHSKSQPDLSALRSRLVEGWADGVARQTMDSEARRRQVDPTSSSTTARRRSHGRKTPPVRPIPLGSGTQAYASSVQPSARHVSPRQSTIALAHLTPITHSPSLSSNDSWGARSPQGGRTGSEDADDDLETDSMSSGSLSFSPKRHRQIMRQRSLLQAADKRLSSAGLGLLLEPGNSGDEQNRQMIDIRAATIEARLLRSSLLSLRMLAIVPAMWGICVLCNALATGQLRADVWPWGVDFSREALELLLAGSTAKEGPEVPVHRGDMVLAIAWAYTTAHFCFGLTTGLTSRWRSYYSLPSTVTRLVSLQCLCWPATYITLWFLGASRPLLAWVVIGVTTGWSRTVQMWVTSNVVDDGGDITPGPYRRVSPPPGPPPPPPKHVTGWRVFTYGRRWDWDAVAREVGWKIGGLLLITTAWLFWRMEGMVEVTVSPAATVAA